MCVTRLGIVYLLQFVQKAEQNKEGADLGGGGSFSFFQATCVRILMLNKAC